MATMTPPFLPEQDEKFHSIHVGSDYNPPGSHQFRSHKPAKVNEHIHIE